MTNSKFKRKIYNTRSLEIAGFKAELQRKKIKRLYLKIDNKNAQLKIIAPLNIAEKIIVDFVLAKKSWIEKAQQKIKHKISSANIDFVEGAVINFLGEKYLLKLLFNSKRPKIYLIKEKNIINISYQEDFFIQNNIFSQNSYEISVDNPENTTKDIIIIDSINILNQQQKIKLLENFYRIELQKIINELTPKWQQIMRVEAKFIGIKKMRTRYGSCNARNKNIWLSLNLIHYPKSFIEYVLVHEFCHFFVQNHGKKFYLLMDKFLPNWRLYKIMALD